ncbi:MAG: TerC family protein, partial [Geminicoccaceae bacterium]|nr:TerC family protein [Geminicoccaceae bacterium]
MLELLNDPGVWASFGTLVLLEIILGVDNIIFISIIAGRLPEEQRPRARYFGLSGALVMRIALLASISWIMGLTASVISVFGIDLSWRDLILLGGGLFLIYKATGEIYVEVEG